VTADADCDSASGVDLQANIEAITGSNRRLTAFFSKSAQIA